MDEKRDKEIRSGKQGCKKENGREGREGESLIENLMEGGEGGRRRKHELG